MGWVPPPRPLTLEKFKARYEVGARTMEELDPELHAWHKAQKRQAIISAILVIVTLFCFLTLVILKLSAGAQ